MIYTVKKFRYAPITGQWEPIRTITPPPAVVEKVLVTPPLDIRLFYRYDVFDEDGRQLATIETADPHLVD